jgi:diguanylate cyclase (GGDEF)-like protein
MDDGKLREAEVFLHHHDGHRLPVIVRASPIRNINGEIIGAVETFSNNEQIIRNRRKVDELFQSAYIDPLTGIGNRRYLEDGMQAAKAMADRGIGIAGLILIDVDNLKYFNDTYGHMIGDQILKMVVRTLKHSLRSIDLLGRWGGDEFIAIAQDVKELDTLQKVANKLRLMVENSSIDFDEGTLSTTISIGATLVNVDEPEIIFRRADRLLYESKQAGKNKITVK